MKDTRKRIDQMQMVKGCSANLERCGCQQKCGVEQDWQAVTKQLRAGVEAGEVEELEIVESLERTVTC